jgi:hypothetical protein
MFSVISCFCIVVRCIIIQSWLSWRHHFEHFTVATKNWLTVMECQCHKWPRIYSTCRKHFPVLSSFMTYHRATRLTRRVPLVEQELLSGVRYIRFLVLCVCLEGSCLCFCPFSFGHCVVCSSSIYGFWLLLWYFQALLTEIMSSQNLSLDLWHSVSNFWLQKKKYKPKKWILILTSLILTLTFDLKVENLHKPYMKSASEVNLLSTCLHTSVFITVLEEYSGKQWHPFFYE